MELFATLTAGLDSTVSGLYAGNTAPMASVMMALSATSLIPMAVELATLFGMKTSANVKILILVARSGVLSGTLSAEQTSTTLLAVFAHLIALLARPILAFHALRIPTVVELVLLLFALQALK